MLLVIATLIAAVTFRAGVNPPVGCGKTTRAQRGRRYLLHPLGALSRLPGLQHIRTRHVRPLDHLAHQQYPFQLEIVAATVSMMVMCASALFVVVPDERVKFRYITLTAFVPVIIRVVIYVFRKYAIEASTV
ncbi:hypothetical protein BT93_L3617 [Corymbia citriodora subsp. variegata]|uniref:PGG domain-containing protein n=1 Tax=Corymbia citriodora subsp. variegata TaxID=360336 RepID=A0A8T0CJB1_CORYI|nr:hypothetical protein BT93_L3617 [Corymbia citriodora subsp. variegata]